MRPRTRSLPGIPRDDNMRMDGMTWIGMPRLGVIASCVMMEYCFLCVTGSEKKEERQRQTGRRTPCSKATTNGTCGLATEHSRQSAASLSASRGSHEPVFSDGNPVHRKSSDSGLHRATDGQGPEGRCASLVTSFQD